MVSTVWKGFISFGLWIPVRLFSGARGETISFHLLHKKDNSRVHEVFYCNSEDKPVTRDELVRGYEYRKGKYVVLTSEEIKKVAPPSAKTMEITEFVKGEQIDPIYFESSYYVAPDESGKKPYALLLEALRQTGFDAIAKVTMHRREHVVILRPSQRGIMLHTMYYADEIRNVAEFQPHKNLVSEKELKLAKTLIASLEADFHPEKYNDAFRDNLKKLIAARSKGREVTAAPEVKPAKVVDIMDALRQSLAGAKGQTPRRAASKKPRRKRAA